MFTKNYKQEDKPKYEKLWIVIIGFLAIVWIVSNSLTITEEKARIKKIKILKTKMPKQDNFFLK